MGGWIGVDLDGTLAHYTTWGTGEIGDPVKKMMELVRHLLAQGKTVKIFTARASTMHERARVRIWLEKHALGDLEITNVKDFEMIVLYDDRCIQVEKNTGRLIGYD